MTTGVVVITADERSPDDSPEVQIDVVRWEALATATLCEEGANGELTLSFVDAADIAALNREYMDKHGPTDVLAFPLDAAGPTARPDSEIPTLLGDVVISPAVAGAQYADHAGTLDDELALLVVHGVLHVLGHDHLDPGDAALMRTREVDVLQAHHWGGPAPSGFRQVHGDTD